MLKRAAFAFSLLVCTAVFAEEEPQWLKDARAREITAMGATEISSEDGWFKVRTPGKLAANIEKVEGSYTVELDVDGDASVYCEVFPEGVDLANGLRSTLRASIAEIESVQGKIDTRLLASTDTGAYGDVPYISLTWLYRVPGPEGPLLGALKQFIMEKGDLGVYCAHNDLGYVQTFAAITRAFAESLKTREPVSAPYYVEISTLSLSGAKLGVAISTLERDADGDSRARQLTSLVLATADGAVRAQDSTNVNWVRPDGTLINAALSQVANGELVSDLGLTVVDDVWTVEGELQGKEVTAYLPEDAQPGSWVRQAQELRALLARPDAIGREHVMSVWVENDPGNLTEVKTKILARHDEHHFKALGEAGSLAMHLILESASGTASAADINLGPIEMKIDRVYVSGAF